MQNWFDSCYRNLFFDYHTQQNAMEVGAAFDGAAWAERLKNAGAQAVSCIAKCGYGWRYYRKGSIGRVHPHLPEGVDMLGDTVRECHVRDIRVIAYYHTFGSEWLCEEHPEWRVRDRDGQPQGIGLCLLGDALEREMLPQLTEIAGNYDVDGVFLDGTYYGGICYCESCQRRFRSETGCELPRSREDESYPVYMSWVEGAYKRVRERCAEAIHAGNPETLLSINWGYTTRQAECVPEGIGFLTQDVSQSNQAFTVSLQARNWALTGVPFNVMNHLALKWWQEWSVKPVYSVLQECALLLANGGRTWMGYQMYPWFGASDALFDTIRTAFDFVRRLEPLVRDARPMPYVGVLHGENQWKSHPAGDYSLFIDETSIFGVHRALTLGGIPYHSACTRDFLEHLPRFRAVILTGDQCLSEDVVERLREYVRNGGCLLVTGKTGMVDETGQFRKNPAMEELIGASVSDGYPYSHGYIDFGERCPELMKGVNSMPTLCARPFLLAEPTTARELAELRCIYLRSDGEALFTEYAVNTQTFSPPGKPTGTAAVLLNAFGAGRVAYIASDVFAAYAGNNQWCLKNMVKNLVNDALLGEKALRIDAPDYVEVALAETDSGLRVHLINLVRESPAINFDGATGNVIGEDALPIHDVGLCIPCKRPRSVRLAEAEPEWRWENGVLTVTVPKLVIHECVIIDY